MRLPAFMFVALVALVVSDPARAALPTMGCPAPATLVETFKADADWQNATLIDGERAKLLIAAINQVGQPSAFEARAIVVVRPTRDPSRVGLVLFDACPTGFFFMSATLFRAAVDRAFGTSQ